MSRLSTLVAFLLAALWLPAALHCELEAADVHFLTHEAHHSDGADHDHGTGADDEHHAFKDAPFTVSAPAVKILPPVDSLSAALLSFLAIGREEVASALSPERHPPPLELTVAWQFMDRAAPPARAPALNV
jgi:hypothetical protein